MKLYIDKILSRIVETQGFEELLSSESEWKKPSVSSPVTPTTGSFPSFNNNSNLSQENKTKKIERRKTLSGWHFRSTSQPQNSFTSSDDKIIVEEPDQIHPLPTDRKSEDTITLGDAPKRVQRRNSASGTRNTKRFSFLNWVGGAAKEEEKKEDPYMRPMILVQEKERKE